MFLASATEHLQSPLFGRADELATLQAAIDSVGEHGSVFVLRGDSGIGKSALLRAACNAAAERGFLTLPTVGVVAESGLPFAGLHCLLRPLMTRIGELPGPQRAILHAAFDALGRDVEDPFLVALAALNLLSAHAIEQPVLVVVDDLHLMDANSREVVGFIARRIAADRIVVLAAVANDFDEQAGQLGLPVYDLRPIERGAAGGLLDTRAPGLPHLVRRRLLAQAQGNPLALHELPAWPPTTAAAGKAYSREVLPVSPRLQQAFTRSLGKLPADTALLLLLGAADPGASTSEILTAAALLTGTCASVASLQPAIDAGLVSLDGVDLCFCHPVLRSAIYQSADVEQRRSIHRALADVLSAHPERSIAHRAEAGPRPDRELAQEVEDAALGALQRGAVGRASMWFALAAELSVGSQRVARLLRSAELASELGMADVVRALCEEVRQNPLEARDLARAAWLCSDFDTSDDGARLLELVELAEQLVANDDLDLGVDVLLSAATRCWWTAARPEICRRVAMTVTSTSVARTDPRCLAALALCAPIDRAAALGADLDLAGSAGPPRAAHLKLMAAHALGDYRATASSFVVTA
jgi:AAA ATPase domain